MHILHVTPYYVPAYAFGGVVRAVEGMARALVRRGHRVTVLTTDALDQSHRYTGPADEMLGGVRVVRCPNVLPRLRGRLNLSTPNTMRDTARVLLADVDVVHCHEFRTMENLLVTPGAAALGRPLILSPHGTLTHTTGRGRLKAAWDRVLSPAVAQRFDHVIGLTADEIAQVEALWPAFGRRRIPAQFSVIPNGVDADAYTDLRGGDEFRRRHGLGTGPVVLFLGRLHARKGVDVLLRAFLAADVVGTQLVFAGPDEGMRAALEAAADERVIFTGYLEGEERLAALDAADLFALPATGEGLSMAALEAMSAGLPVLLSPGCHLPEAAEAGAGVIVEPAVEPLADALRPLLIDAGRRQAMGAAGQKLVRERFTWEAVAIRLEAVYELYG